MYERYLQDVKLQIDSIEKRLLKWRKEKKNRNDFFFFLDFFACMPSKFIGSNQKNVERFLANDLKLFQNMRGSNWNVMPGSNFRFIEWNLYCSMQILHKTKLQMIAVTKNWPFLLLLKHLALPSIFPSNFLVDDDTKRNWRIHVKANNIIMLKS